MDLLLELSLEHPTLAAADAVGAMEALGQATVVDDEVGVLVARAEGFTPEALAGRIAFTHDILFHHGTTEPDPIAILDVVRRIPIDGRRFVVRARRIGGSPLSISSRALEIAAGSALQGSGIVDLHAPEVEVRILVSGRAFIGTVAARVDRKRMEERHVKNRPVFSPTTIHPRQALALVNLARVSPGSRVLDPFCGTGGIALEAALVGGRVFASDLDPRMVAGTRDTLTQFGCGQDATVELRDVGEAPEFAGPLDAVATDPPYGRASTTNREGITALYARALAAAHDALAPDGRLAIVWPSESWIEDAQRHGFRLVESHAVKVHASLTRHVTLYERA